MTVNTSLEDAYGNRGRLTIVLQRCVHTVFINRYFYSCNVMLPPLSEKDSYNFITDKDEAFCPLTFSCSMVMLYF